MGSVLPLQHFPRVLPGQRTAALVLSQPFVPAATRGGPQAVVLSRGQAGGARAARSGAAASGLPASPGSRVLWGRRCQLGEGCRTPSHQSVSSAESSSPEPLVPPGSQRSGSLHWASLGDHGFVCPRTQPAPRDRHAGHSLALPELASLPSCLGTHQHHSSHALERGRSNICPRLVLQLALLQLQC